MIIIALLIGVIATGMITEIVLGAMILCCTFVFSWYRFAPQWWRSFATTIPIMMLIDLSGYYFGWVLLPDGTVAKFSFLAFFFLALEKSIDRFSNFLGIR